MNLRKTITDVVAAAIAGKTPGGAFPCATDLYSADNTDLVYAGDNSVVRNPNCWAAGWDLTGVPFHAPWYPASCGTAVTPRHLLTTQHILYLIPDGSTIIFMDSTGARISRTVLAASDRNVNRGPAVILLDMDLPATVAKYPLLPDDWMTYANYSGFGLPTLHCSHGRQGLYDIPQASMAYLPFNDILGRTFWNLPVYVGDSGSPYFLPVENNLVMCGIAGGGSVLPPSPHIARLQADMDSLSAAHSAPQYDFLRYDLSGYAAAHNVPFSILMENV